MISGTKEIITDLDKLGIRSDEVDIIKENKEVREIVNFLKRTLKKTDGMKALSAPVIGYNKRIFCIKYGPEDVETYINPVISNQKGLQLSRETCYCIPGKEYIRIRTNDINVMYQKPTGKTESKHIVGYAALVFQHEIDHLDGITLEDLGLECWPEFDSATEEERNEVINSYIDSLDLNKEQINKEIEEDPELKKIIDASRFMDAAIKKKSMEIKASK